MIKFFCKRDSTDYYNGRKLYHGFPRPMHGSHKTAKEWLTNANHQETVELVTDNRFNAYIFENVSSRGMRNSSKIPQVVLHFKEHDVYVCVDFRLDGLINILTNHSVTKGVVDVDVGVRFSGTNYYIEEISNILTPVETVKGSTKKPKIRPTVGEWYYLDKQKHRSYQYIGCYVSESGTSRYNGDDISGKKFHLFVCEFHDTVMVNGYRSIPINISVAHRQRINFTDKLKITTTYGNIGSYGFDGTILIDLINNTFSIIPRIIKKQCSPCGW